MIEVVSPMKTWRLTLQEGRVSDKNHLIFAGKTEEQVRSHCLRRGWLVRTVSSSS